MAYITAIEIKEGLNRLHIPLVTAPCSEEEFHTLISHDRLRVTVGGQNGVLISYHLVDSDPDDLKEVIVAYTYPELHRPVSDEIQQLISKLFTNH